MQLICEAYQLMKEGLGLSNEEMHARLHRVEQGRARQLPHRNHARHPRLQRSGDGRVLSWTRSWTPPARRAPASGPASSSLDLGMPVTLIGEAVYARCLSAMKDDRVAASEDSLRPEIQVRWRPQGVHRRYPAGAAGFEDRLLRAGLHAAARGGQRVQVESELRRNRHDVARRLHHPPRLPRQDQGGVRPRRRISATCCSIRISRKSSSAASRPGAASWPRPWRRACRCRPSLPRSRFFDGYRSERLPANLLQAQRDYFGAHTYERVDQPRGKFFHTNWTGKGGTVSAGTYTV